MYSYNRCIDTKVKVGSFVFFMTFVYGDPVKQHRRLVWDKIKTLCSQRNEAWFLVGGFNEVMNNFEKLGCPQRVESSFYVFCSFARDCRIKELPSCGNKLSWAEKERFVRHMVPKKMCGSNAD